MRNNSDILKNKADELQRSGGDKDAVMLLLAAAGELDMLHERLDGYDLMKKIVRDIGEDIKPWADAGLIKDMDANPLATAVFARAWIRDALEEVSGP
jgi:predicted hydrolase (HD superfamily)